MTLPHGFTDMEQKIIPSLQAHAKQSQALKSASLLRGSQPRTKFLKGEGYIITIVSKWHYLEEALSGSEELAGFSFHTVNKLSLPCANLVILDEEHESAATNVIRIGNFAHADLQKPVRLSELIKLINSKLQRKVIMLAQLEFDPIKKSLKKDDSEVLITKKEAELLEFLAIHKDEEFSAKDLLHQVWGYGNGIKTNTLDTHLYGLRKSLEAVGIKNFIRQKSGKYKICLR